MAIRAGEVVAVGVLDMALWDAVAKIEEKPLYRVLAERFHNGVFDTDTYVYAAGGYYYPGKEIEGLLDEMRGYLDLGYSTVKIKIGGAPLADDLKRIEAVLGILGPGQDLAVDANGRFDRDTAIAYVEALNAYSLKWYEEPCEPLDYEIHREVAKTRASSKCSPSMGGLPAAAFLMAAINSPFMSPPEWGCTATNRTPASSSPSADSPTVTPWSTDA
jgi:L-alanine-DL-glutamate epimerase-like enolase superfamily enzyme